MLVLLRYCSMLLAEDVFSQPADCCPECHHADRADAAGYDPSGHQEESGRQGTGELMSESSASAGLFYVRSGKGRCGRFD